MYQITMLFLFFLITGTQAAILEVTVGGPGILQYTPEFVIAAPGDVVIFNFKQKNHTATQSSFSNPCTKAVNGFDSGFVPVADSLTSGFPTARLTIIDTSPIWVFCRQANHCSQGMVFAVNPGDKFAAFKAAATGGSNTSSTLQPTATQVITVTQTITSSGQTAVTTYTSSAPASSPSATSTDNRVIVGGTGILAYQPSNITAQVGDTVTFEFHQKNHTVTASSFDNPCRALSSTSTTGEVGFDSGFVPVADNATTFPTYTVQINNTNPIWAYCRQATHCGSGMVFAVNAVATGPKNFSAFQDQAKKLNGTSSSGTGSVGNGASPAFGPNYVVLSAVAGSLVAIWQLGF